MSETVHLGQTQSSSFADRLCGEERIKYPIENVPRYSNAGIFDGNLNDIVVISRSNDNRSPVRHGITRVDYEIDEGCFKLAGIDHDRSNARRGLDGECDRTPQAAP